MSDGYMPRNEGTSFSVQSICSVSIIKVCGNSAQFIYPDTVVILEVQQTRDSFGKWLVKLKFHFYIALVGERNVNLRGGAVA